MSDDQNRKPNLIETFRREAFEFWERLPDKPLFFSLLGVWAALFHFYGNCVFGWVETRSLFGWMYFVFDTSPEDGHGKLVPFVVLALFWWKRKELLQVPKQVWSPALTLIVLGLVLHLIGYLVQQTRISIIGFFVGVYGLMGLVWGRAWLKATFFPMILFVFCVPLGTMNDALTFPLRKLVAAICVGFSDGALGIPVAREGTLIFHTQHLFKYDVAAACSGIRSLISLLALTTIYGFMTFNSTWKRLFVIATAIPLAIAGNVLRITTVIIVGEAFGHDAGTRIEQKLGFLTFAVAVAALLALGHWLRERPDIPTMPPKAEPA
jgi:exosortase